MITQKRKVLFIDVVKWTIVNLPTDRLLQEGLQPLWKKHGVFWQVRMDLFEQLLTLKNHLLIIFIIFIIINVFVGLFFLELILLYAMTLNFHLNRPVLR